MAYELRREDDAYSIYDPAGRKVAGSMQRDTAMTVRDNMERRAAMKPRTCLTCRETFASEGPHNRICYPCKQRIAGQAGDYTVAGPA